MRFLDKQYKLEPQLTPFQANILISIMNEKEEEMRAGARANPDQVASYVASMVEYQHIREALEKEREQYKAATGA